MGSGIQHLWRPGSTDEQSWTLPGEPATIGVAADAENDYASLPRDDGARKRKRISKACEACRRRKIKCDGKEVCGCCAASSLDCVYTGIENEKIIKDNLQGFDSRLQRLEGMFEEFLKRMEGHAPASGPAVSGHEDEQAHRQPTPAPSPDAPSLGAASLAGARQNGQGEEFESINGHPVAEEGLQNHVEQSTEAVQSVLSSPISWNHKRHRRQRGHKNRGNRRHTYADAYGELQPDSNGNLRYIGLGSTRAMVDVCTPFRDYLNRGTGKISSKYTHDSSASTRRGFSDKSGLKKTGDRREILLERPPPRMLLIALINWYYDRLYFMLPVVSKPEFDRSFAETSLKIGGDETGGFTAVVYGILALAALSFPQDHEVFRDREVATYKYTDIGTLFFDEAVAQSTPAMTYGIRGGLVGPDLNTVNALTLQAAYLSTTGSQADAWMCIGQAARIGQDIGLHRSPSLLGFDKAEQERRKYAWWCIYSLDRMLSMALGRPVAIRDIDCDIELEGEDGLNDIHMGFLTILSLRRILGNILDTVSAVGTVKRNRHVNKIPEIRAHVNELSSELQTWVTSKVPESLKAAEEGNLKVERLLALSGYFSALMLLYRYLISNPHRSSPLKGGEAAMQCARAATNCIGITAKLLDSIPVSPELIFHLQNVFTASMVLLHCIRRSEDSVFKEAALKQVEVAIHSLRRLQPFWTEVETMARCLEEYLELILESLEKGASFRKCLFHHDAHELTGLEWRHETSDDAMNFPVWPDMDLTNLFGSEINSTNLQTDPDSRPNSQVLSDNGVPTQSYHLESSKDAGYNQASVHSPSGSFSLDSRLQAMDQALWGYMYNQGTSDTTSNHSARSVSIYQPQR